jgi:pyridoxal phosphate enzyme (YggS family)
VIDAAAVRVALEQVRVRIRAAGGDDDVAVLAVTKGFGPDAVEAAVAAGCPVIGENYAQEVLAKRDAIERTGARVHFIGQLQSNKVRQLAGLVDVYESVDRPSLVNELARRSPGARVLVQAAALDEPGKGGAALDDVPALVEAARDAGLDVAGLMTVGPTRGGPEAARTGFRAVRSLVDRLGLAVCSMGMTDDLEVAVAEGSTQVRIGTALFGRRAPVSSSEQDR